MEVLTLDAMNMIRRIYEANPVPSSKEKADQAFKAFKGSLRRAIEENPSDYRVAAFEGDGPTWRHVLYPKYKEGRNPAPPELIASLPNYWDELADKGFKVYKINGVEADDVIATMVYRGLQKSNTLRILSTDKDLCILLQAGVTIRDHFGNVERDAGWVKNKFGVSSEKLLDFLTLVGDKTDGVPGVDGIGPKTAVAMLEKYGSVDAILDALDELKPAMAEKLSSSLTSIYLSRALVTMKTDVPLQEHRW